MRPFFLPLFPERPEVRPFIYNTYEETFYYVFAISGNDSFLTAQQKYQPTEANLKARSEFQDNKFGIFLHWGLYAMLATGEWTMTNNNLNYKEYAKLAGDSILRSLMQTNG